MATEPQPNEPTPEDFSVVSDVFAVADENAAGNAESDPDRDPVMRYTQGGSPC